jgi:starch phosphorylase
MPSATRPAGPVKSLRSRLDHHLTYSLGRTWKDASPREAANAAALAIRQHIIDRLIDTDRRYDEADAKRIYYLSIEFLLGRALGNNLHNLGQYDAWRQTAKLCGLDFDAMLEAEPDPALGNGGIGRLAACVLDSMATLGLPGVGYGINYEFGLFRQRIDDGYQQERPDHWLGTASPWLLERADEVVFVPVYGRVAEPAEGGRDRWPLWLDWQLIVGVPYDMPVVGYGGRTVNVLRLFSARGSDDFDISILNSGDYVRAIEQKISSETISKVLYPPDAHEAGRELRLLQEYFLVACALRDIIRRYRRQHGSFDLLPARAAVQLNGTQPALAIPELMRQLVDEHGLPWDAAWALSERTFAFTSHDQQPDARETWPLWLLERVLPRHAQIIAEIDRRFLASVSMRFPGEPCVQARVSIVDQAPESPEVRMAHLAIIGSHSTNGVTTRPSDLGDRGLMSDFHRLWPERFGNRTNGITPRRWLLAANPPLATLVNRTIGRDWVTDPARLRELEPYADDQSFQRAFVAARRMNKAQLAHIVQEATGTTVDPGSLFDVQAKRIHTHTRQLLNVLHIVHQYLAIVEDKQTLPASKTYLFAGKATPGDSVAKLIIKLIHDVAQTVNGDPVARQQMRVAFVPDYRMSLAERIIPAADLSEQISTAGLEAAGTGPLKFALNGALTIGTLAGANVAIRQEVGADNIYIFGLTVDDVERLHRDGYDPRAWYQTDAGIARVLDAIRDGRFSPGEPELFHPVVHRLLDAGDPEMLLAEFKSYADVQARALEEFGTPELWARKAILNTAHAGVFSSDRTVADYAREVWHVGAL